ncbi:unnamed protein product [Lepidochelys kempii]
MRDSHLSRGYDAAAFVISFRSRYACTVQSELECRLVQAIVRHPADVRLRLATRMGTLSPFSPKVTGVCAAQQGHTLAQFLLAHTRLLTPSPVTVQWHHSKYTSKTRCRADEFG